ncbi:hypothetical protein C1645_820033 [Glomus cerebriforme]|uniref:Uncharacterized protein n=1 Tax=Glomus cerebriforme TaxID=658196 RepID=A0A397TDA5_9GLOM|nr:hypothetical protein C1645_820033 [Glomus cerebriforme]
MSDSNFWYFQFEIQQNKICKGCYVSQNYKEFLNEKENVNKFYEEENEELYLTFNIKLSSFYDTILKDNESNKENNEHEIDHYIIKDFKKNENSIVKNEDNYIIESDNE